MFNRHELSLLHELVEGKYHILEANGHDVALQSLSTGHEWVIITNYGGGCCRIRHRHSRRDPFHDQQGRYESLNGALVYIERHDEWFYAKEMARRKPCHYINYY